MRVGLIDCDKHNPKNPFPNLALMKLSAWHKKQGDTVEWYEGLFSGHFDKESLPKGHELKKLQRWVNNRFVWERTPTFEEYLKGETNA